MSSTEKSVILVFTVAINVTFKLSGDEFFIMSISKIMVTYVKHLLQITVWSLVRINLIKSNT